MDKNTSGALLLLILTAAALHASNGWAVTFIVTTAVLSFLAAEVRDALDYTGDGRLRPVGFLLALASWATVALAMLSLLI